MAAPLRDDLADQPYEDALDHLEDHFERLALLLDRYAILHPTSEQARELVTRRRHRAFVRSLGQDRQQRLSELDGELARIDARIRSRLALTNKGPLPLQELADVFGLDPLSIGLVVAIAAPQVNPAFQSAYGKALANAEVVQADVAFFATLLTQQPGVQAPVLDRLAADARLLRWKLVELGQVRSWVPETPLIYRRARVPDRVVDFITGRATATALPPFARRVQPRMQPHDLQLPEGVRAAVDRAMTTLLAEGALRPPPLLNGPRGCGKKALAETLAKQAWRELIVVDLEGVPPELDAFESAISDIAREALLTRAWLYIDHLHALIERDDETGMEKLKSRSHLTVLAAALADYAGPLLYASDNQAGFRQLGTVVSIEVPFPTREVQRSLFMQWLPVDVALGDDVKLDNILLRYSLAGGGLRAALDQAIASARARDDKAPVVTFADLQPALRRQLTHRLGSLAEPMETSLGWKDLIIDEDTKDRVLEILAFARNRELVMGKWGFDRKMPYGRGLSALFAGPPGTGKTMVATLIAKELGLELFRIDLSKVVNKYIGETEKNLSRVFAEARRGQVVLLFDEADALFAKRTEVRSSHDRYANLEVNFLLQQVEAYEGVLLLTTNFEKGIDDAFKRRIKLRITFPFPDEHERKRLWESMFTPEVELEGDIDTTDLAKEFRLTGGHIKSAVVRAAFLAADQGCKLDQRCLMRGAQLEWQELGNLLPEGAQAPVIEEVTAPSKPATRARPASGGLTVEEVPAETRKPMAFPPRKNPTQD